MARRRIRTSATGGNLDSLLDTLTNVVGILVIVLVTVQLSSQEAASRIAAAVAKVDPEETERLEQEAAAARATAAEAAREIERAKQAARDPRAEAARLRAEAAVEEERARLAAEKAAALEKQSAAAAEAGRQAVAAHATEKAKREESRRKAEAKRASLQATLASLPAPTPPPAKQVRLPDPRPAPKDAKELRVLCREGRVWVVDIAALQEPAKKRADYVVRHKKLDPDGDTWLTDGKTFVDDFNDAPIREDGFEMKLMLAGGMWPNLVLARRPGSGQTAEEAVRGSGDLAKALRRLEPGTHYVRFFVWPDAFDTYLKVRDFTAERGYAAGWEPMASGDEYRISLGKYAVGKKPPPSPPSTAPPKPPENVVD